MQLFTRYKGEHHHSKIKIGVFSLIKQTIYCIESSIYCMFLFVYICKFLLSQINLKMSIFLE